MNKDGIMYALGETNLWIQKEEAEIYKATRDKTKDTPRKWILAKRR